MLRPVWGSPAQGRHWGTGMSLVEATKVVRAGEREVQGEAELGLISLEKGKGRSHWCLQVPNRRGH